VSWHILSADGHPVGGTFAFSIGESGAASRIVPVTRSGTGSVSNVRNSRSPTGGVTEKESPPVAAAALRGLGLGAMMAGLGLLFFAGGRMNKVDALPLATRLLLVGAASLIAHMIAWLNHITPPDSWNGNIFGTTFDTRLGQVELLRVILAVLTVWGLVLARRVRLTLVLGAAFLLVSGAVGHPAAIVSSWTIPAKAMHLLAGAIWLGGLIWLVIVSRDPNADFQTEARRVSSAALISVILVGLSGTIQARFFLTSPFDLWQSDYGRLVTAKIIGLLLLVGYGAYNRYRLVPALATGETRAKLTRSVAQEIALVSLLIVIGGFLSYLPTPPLPASTTTHTQEPLP
jgi:putative copper export protein